MLTTADNAQITDLDAFFNASEGLPIAETKAKFILLARENAEVMECAAALCGLDEIDAPYCVSELADGIDWEWVQRGRPDVAYDEAWDRDEGGYSEICSECGGLGGEYDMCNPERWVPCGSCTGSGYTPE